MFRRNLTRQWQLVEGGVDTAMIHTPDQRPIAIAFASSLPTPQLEGIELSHRQEPYLFLNGNGQNLYARAAYAQASVIEYLVGRGSAQGQGPNGLNAYEVFVQNGYQGTVEEWMDLIGQGDGSSGGNGLGGLRYQGTWNAATNQPALPTPARINSGWYYRVSVAGNTVIDGNGDWAPGDWLISNGESWDKIDNTDQVVSVAGRRGAVVLGKSDVGLANVDNTSDATKPVSIPQQTALNAKAADADVRELTKSLQSGQFAKTAARVATRLFVTPEATPDTSAYRAIDALSPFNPNYEGGNIIAQHIRHVAEGTNKNGPRGAALGLGVSIMKEGYGSGSAKGGEIDGLYVVVRQDSPRNGAKGELGSATGDTVADRGDGCGILIDAAVYEQVGFVGGIEGATSVIKNDNSAITQRLVYQFGCTDTTRDNSRALYGAAEKGRVSEGLLLSAFEGAGGYFDDYLKLNNSYGTIFRIDRNGVHSYGRFVNGQARTLSDMVHLLVQEDGSLGWANAGLSVQLMNLNQDGDLHVGRAVNAQAMNVAGNPVVVERAGNWTPLLRGSNGTAVGTYTSSGTWRRVGGIVYVTAEWDITAVGGASGSLQITNMPFPRSAVTSLSGRIVSGTSAPSSMIQGFGGVNNPSVLTLARYDTTQLVVVHAGNVTGAYSTNAG